MNARDIKTLASILESIADEHGAHAGTIREASRAMRGMLSALELIASCRSYINGDVVSIAQDAIS